MADTKKIIGAAAGVAAAAAAAGVAVARRKGRTPVTYHVRPDGEGWRVTADGTDDAHSRHGTKKDAVSAGRKVAGTRVPSELVIHRADGTIQRKHSYSA